MDLRLVGRRAPPSIDGGVLTYCTGRGHGRLVAAAMAASLGSKSADTLAAAAGRPGGRDDGAPSRDDRRASGPKVNPHAAHTHIASRVLTRRSNPCPPYHGTLVPPWSSPRASCDQALQAQQSWRLRPPHARLRTHGFVLAAAGQRSARNVLPLWLASSSLVSWGWCRCGWCHWVRAEAC